MLRRVLGFNFVDVGVIGFVGLFALLSLYPMWYVFIVSMTPYAEYITRKLFLLPPLRPTFEYYDAIVIGGREIFLRTMTISVVKTGVGATLAVCITAMFAYGVSKRYVMGTRTLNVLMVFTLFFGGGLIPSYLLLVQLGLIRTFWAMILPLVLNTGHFIIMRNFFSYSVPAELEDAALIDGSTEFRTFFLVVLPLSKAMIAAIFLFEAVFHWNDYYSLMMFVREPKLMPFVSLLQKVLEDPIYTLRSASGQVYVEEEGLPPPKQLVMTTIVLAMAPIMMLYPFLQRHFAKGILIGAVKE